MDSRFRGNDDKRIERRVRISLPQEALEKNPDSARLGDILGWIAPAADAFFAAEALLPRHAGKLFGGLLGGFQAVENLALQREHGRMGGIETEAPPLRGDDAGGQGG